MIGKHLRARFWDCRQNGQPLFDGPSSTALTAEKYMSQHKAASRKRAKQEAEEALRMVRTPGFVACTSKYHCKTDLN